MGRKKKDILVICWLWKSSSRFIFLYHGEKMMLDYFLVYRALFVYHKGLDIHNEPMHDESIAASMEKK
ncbi:hypothetical protein C5S42_12600 [Candidatus Methanomarinus sp.]|nr:hypothetical protein C5S42_12600 [ANME-2 cluster archaeon]